MATKPNDDSSLSHTRWNCKYHIVFIPKISKKRNIRKITRRYWKDNKNIM